MTDDELLALVQTKSPEELTEEETAQLRQRLRESESLRTALFETLQMESYLAAALGPIDLRSEQIIARAGQAREQQSRSWTWIAGGLGCLLLLILGFGIFRAALNLGDTPIAEAPQPKPEEVKPSEPEVKPEPENQSPVETPEAKTTEQPAATTDPNPPAEEKKPEPPKVVQPWDDVLALPAEKLPAFYDVCFDDFPYKSFLPRREVINKWFEAVSGCNYRVIDADTQKGKCGKIEGFARLKAPLPADGGIRFALQDYNHLAIHAYHGNDGVMLVYYQDLRDRWTAYRLTRKDGESKAETVEIIATDDERTRRAEIRYGGPLELRYRDGELLLLRGDIALVRAPLPGLPDDIYFEGRTVFEGLSLVRTNDLPLQPEPAIAGSKLRPADLLWQEKLSVGATLQKQEDGSIRLVSKEPAEPSYVSTPLPGVGYREIVFELAEVRPGLGVYLAQSEGQTTHLCRVVQNSRTKRLNVTLRGPDDFYEGDLPPITERPEYAVGDKLWIKFLAGNGCLKWWVSGDGLHWAIGDPVVEDAPGKVATLGITTCRTKAESGGTLLSVTVRELAAINALAPREVIEQAPALTMQPTLETWSSAALESCPTAIQWPQWRRACAIRSLGAGLPRALATPLLESLLDDVATQGLPPQQQIDVLREVMLVDTDPRDGAVWKRGYLTRLHEAGRRMAASGGLPFSSVRKVLMEAPVHTAHALPVAVQGEAEEELIRLLQQGKADEALQLCNLLKLYHFHENRPLFAWAEASARRDTNRMTGDITRAKESWKQPLVEELNKDVYNFAADLHAILESGALEDASRMIAALESDSGTGITPSGTDHDLFVSLSGAVKLALAQQPGLRDELTQRLAPLAALRIRQAIASGDEGAIALAATQFEGTEAAAEAYRWLGDRALQFGWFTRALAEYRRAESSASPSLSRELLPRTRLAAAMTGSDAGSAVTETVTIGDARMSAAEFEALVAEMKARGAGPLHGSAASVGKLPGPMQLVAQNRARFDGPVGQNPHDDGAPRMSQWQIDYAGRQLATAVDGDILYVSNRFQIAAYNMVSGQRIWQSQTPPGEMRRGQDWALTPMRPLVTANAIFARQLYGKSPALVCYEKSSGKIVWQRDGSDNEWWVSDPVLVQGQLLTLNLSRDGSRDSQLRLTSLDPFTGEVLVQQRLITLRESWQPRKVCEITSLDDGLVATLGGVTLCCDASGNVRWVRKHLVLPAEERPEWVFQHFAPPLVIDSRMISLQPGVETIDCLEVTTGRLLWQFAGERPWRLLGRSGEQVIAETEAGLIALDLDTGNVAWRHDEPERRLTAAAVSDQYVAYMVRRGAADKPKMPALMWLEAASGQTIGALEFPQWQDNDPRIGPLVVAKDKLWTFFSKEKDPNKDVVELVAGPPLTSSIAPNVSAWQRTLNAALVQTVAEVAPGWQLVSGYPRANVEKKAEWQSEKDAAVILSRPDLPAALVTSVELPQEKKPKLHLRIGHEAHPPGQFTIRVDGETMLTQEWKPENGNRWDSLLIDLAKFAGKEVVISLSYHSTTADQALWLKSAQIVAE